jgi:diacylglycerol O-acyltransferase
VSGAEILAVVLDLDRYPRRAARPPSVVAPEPAPSALEMAGRGVRNLARSASRLVRGAPGVLSHLTDLPGAGSLPMAGVLAALTQAPRPAAPPRTPLSGRVSQERAYAFSSLPLADVKTVRKALGLTINDVVMALCTTALRQWLSDHDALPATPLVAGVPVSVRSADELGAGGNRISFMLVPLPTDVEDPLGRARVLQDALAAAKRRVAQAPSRLLDDATTVLPQVFGGLLPRTLLTAARLGRPPLNVLISNVPGPQCALYAAGARVVGNHPVSLVSDVSGGLNITVMSYDGKLDIGVVACPRIVPDVWAITGQLRDALEELLALTGSVSVAAG